MLRTKRTIVGAVAATLLPFAVAVPPAHAEPTAAEKEGCQEEDDKLRFQANLRRNGNSRPDIGYLLVSSRPSPSDNDDTRWCLLLRFGKKTYGEKHYAMVKIGSRDQGDTDNPVTWYYRDAGIFTKHAGGVALTPGEDRCPAFKGKLIDKDTGKVYARFHTGDVECN